VVLLLVAVAAAAGWQTLAPQKASAYSYQSSIYYLWNIGYSDHVQEAMYVSYGDWSCSPGLCSIPIWSTQQYLNINNSSYEFACWTQQVYSSGGSIPVRWDWRTISYSTTPWYNPQGTWGWANSTSGNQLQYGSAGTTGNECGQFGAGGGAHVDVSIIRNSSSAYTSAAQW